MTGPNDISRETRIRMQPGRAAMIPMITHCILAARAHGLEILDGPYSDFSNVDGFGQECAQGRDLGFDGKTLIHPGQIDACNTIFTPPAEEVDYARKIIAAFERPENASRGAIQLDGGMVERLHTRWRNARSRLPTRSGDGELARRCRHPLPQGVGQFKAKSARSPLKLGVSSIVMYPENGSGHSRGTFALRPPRDIRVSQLDLP